MFSQASVILSMGGVWQTPPRADTPPTSSRRLLQRAVRILLECILVASLFYVFPVTIFSLKAVSSEKIWRTYWYSCKTCHSSAKFADSFISEMPIFFSCRHWTWWWFGIIFYMILYLFCTFFGKWQRTFLEHITFILIRCNTIKNKFTYWK